jgi:hypothetical protein
MSTKKQVSALARQRQRDGATDPTRGARNQRPLSADCLHGLASRLQANSGYGSVAPIIGPVLPVAAISTAGHLPAAIIGNIPSLRQEKGNSIFLQYAPQNHQKGKNRRISRQLGSSPN